MSNQELANTPTFMGLISAQLWCDVLNLLASLSCLVNGFMVSHQLHILTGEDFQICFSLIDVGQDSLTVESVWDR